jgi:hypothetical protein
MFDEMTKNAFCFFTFFNIQTREIYWIAETKNEGVGPGLKRIFGYGMAYSTKLYFDDVYQKALKGK